jgi:uncharacterized repeat protein (TIGR03803 family)
MRTTKHAGTENWSTILSAVVALGAITFGLRISARAQSETVLFSFSGGATGQQPSSSVIFDPAGNLYGTAVGGLGAGLVYELSPVGGTWSEAVLYQFTGGVDGNTPRAVVRDSSGNLYGTAAEGGDLAACNTVGCGVVFELSPSSGRWMEKVLYSFTGGADGALPSAGLVFDAAGNLYGMAENGGNSSTGCSPGCGVVFELSPSTSGLWTETVLHTFVGTSDGSHPFGQIALHAGTLSGTTFAGGSINLGTVFQMKRGSSGWSFASIHSFVGGSDGSLPEASVVSDAAGRLYGTTLAGGAFGLGVAFEMRPSPGGTWRFGVLHNFTGFRDGALPVNPFVVDGAGDIYGVTLAGGIDTECQDNGCGVVFKLTPGSGETVLHTFTGMPDGYGPDAGLILDSAGNLFGTTQQGGLNDAGSVFEVIP